ncbi:MAG: acyl-CoA dehydrogenase [Myxococcota bacterium]|nr:acyl-CoA dehydrogenase [Myxococcota bacterium]
MSTINHYKANLRDGYFNLFEFWKIQEGVLGQEPYTTLDEQTCRDVMATFAKFCEEEMAPSFVEGDRTPLTLSDDGDVTLPEGLITAMNKFFEGEWHRIEHPEHRGGYGAPKSLQWACFEHLVGANPPLGFYLLGNFMAKIIDQHGTDSQKAKFVDGLCNKRWGGTMVLTEPDAGSDVGAGRTKARHLEGDVWEIEGVKLFIPHGVFNGTDNIIHMVLARPEGADLGTKGLSLFIVPKYWVNDDGSLGERNGAYCTNLEKKMGLKASSTCEMTFGERHQCKGILLGEVHDGIRQMFHVIEYARMGVGVKSAATLSTAYLNALEYTKDRVQGPDLLKATDKTSPRVAIIKHPDVRRLLMKQKAYSEGMRALYLLAAITQDDVELAAARGDADEAKRLHHINDLILPLVKGFSSERGYEILSDALQCLGGSGYCQDYPHEQYIRDQKIDTLYEGTTAIQGLDLIFRKIMRDQGATLQGIMGKIQESLAQEIGGDALAGERAALARALQDFGGILQIMMSKVSESLYHVGLHSTRILFALSELMIGWLLVRQAALASEKLEGATGEDAAFYEGKVAAARYFCAEELPRVGMARKVIKDGSLYLMEMSDEAF